MSSSTANADFVNIANWQGISNIPEYKNNDLITGDGLKRQNEPINHFLSIAELKSFKYGYYLGTNGELIPDTPALICTYDITGYSHVIISGRQGSNADAALAAFYDTNDNVIEIVIRSAGTTYIDYILSVPTNAVKICVCSSSTNKFNAVRCKGITQQQLLTKTECIALSENMDLNDIKTYGIYSFNTTVSPTLVNAPRTSGGGYLIVERSTPAGDLNQYVKQTVFYGLGYEYTRFYTANGWGKWFDAKENSDIIDGDLLGVKALYALSSLVGYKLLNDGNVEANSSGIVNTYSINGFTKLLITGRQGGVSDGFALACFYDTNEQLISAVIGQSSTNYTNYLVDVPNNAKIIKVSTSSSYYQTNVYCLGAVNDDGIALITEQLKAKELLSKSGASSLSENMDLNDIKTYGIYSFNSVVSPTLVNAPRTSGQGYLIVERSTPAGSLNQYVKQTVFYGLGYEYTRFYTANDWGEWFDAKSSVKDIQNQLKSIPTYWQEYMDAKVITVRAKQDAIAENGDNFVFITDIHINSNFGNAPKLIKYVLDKTSVRSVVIGGDLFNDASAKQQGLDYLQRIKNDYNFTERVYPIRGNHDSENSLSAGEYYSVMLRPLENILDTMDRFPYYIRDNKAQKIRYIYCDEPSYKTALTNTQKTWIQNKITELQSGWTVILFAHAYWNATEVGQPETVTTFGASLVAAIDEVVPNANATIAALIVGHTHADRDTTSSQGYKIISTSCDANGTLARHDSVTPTRTAGTTTEQLFDVYNIDTANRKIYITRIGGNGSDREFTY